MTGFVPKEFVCSECHKLTDGKTGEWVPGWKNAVFVKASPLLCGECKESIITELSKGVPHDA